MYETRRDRWYGWRRPLVLLAGFLILMAVVVPLLIYVSELLAMLVFVVVGGSAGAGWETWRRRDYRCPKCRQPLGEPVGLREGDVIKFKCDRCEIIWDTGVEYHLTSPTGNG